MAALTAAFRSGTSTAEASRPLPNPRVGMLASGLKRKSCGPTLSKFMEHTAGLARHTSGKTDVFQSREGKTAIETHEEATSSTHSPHPKLRKLASDVVLPGMHAPVCCHKKIPAASGSLLTVAL